MNVLLKHFPIWLTWSLQRLSLAHLGHHVYNRVTFVPQRAHMPSAVSRCPRREQAPSAGKVTPVCQRWRSAGADQDGQYRQGVSKKLQRNQCLVRVLNVLNVVLLIIKYLGN